MGDGRKSVHVKMTELETNTKICAEMWNVYKTYFNANESSEFDSLLEELVKVVEKYGNTEFALDLMEAFGNDIQRRYALRCDLRQK